MNSTNQAPKLKTSDFKRTKIIATVGPATNNYESIYELINFGANGIRLNFSHGSNEERIQQIKWIRKASSAIGKPVTVFQDIQGPKIRLGDFEGEIQIATGQSLSFKYNADYERSGHIPTQYDLSKKVKRGENILLFDGKIRTIVTSVKDGIVYATAENNGVVTKRKGINLPDTDLGGDILTTKDKEDLAFGSSLDIDYVAISFVQTADDVKKVRKILQNLGSKCKIISKIETAAALDNIDEIIQETDAVMIARGDLAVETLHELVPVMQRKIIGLGQLYAKPTIVATHMMASMTTAPEPTRAEVSDVATAVIVGADCVMLSDETAVGSYPTEAVKMVKKIIKYTETNSPLNVSFNHEKEDKTNQAAICHTIIELAERIHAAAIVAETKSGATALQISCRRPKMPIIAVTSDERVCNQMAIVYGTKAFLRPDSRMAADKLSDWLRRSKVLNKGDMIVTASGKYPGVVGTTDTIKVRVLE